MEGKIVMSACIHHDLDVNSFPSRGGDGVSFGHEYNIYEKNLVYLHGQKEVETRWRESSVCSLYRMVCRSICYMVLYAHLITREGSSSNFLSHSASSPLVTHPSLPTYKCRHHVPTYIIVVIYIHTYGTITHST